MHPIPSVTSTPDAPETAVLSTLRALLPKRRMLLSEALRIAELQANRLSALRGYADVPVPLEVIEGLPRLIIELDNELPREAASGVSYWDDKRRSWIIGLNPDEPQTRQRMSALHEYKHIIDHYHPGIVDNAPRRSGLDPIEYIADYFAGCVLIPKRLLKAAFFDGVQRVADLAELFDVSRRAIEVRLGQVGLSRNDDEPTEPNRPRYRRQQPGYRRTVLLAGVGS